jgi:hypothetical protein
MKNRFQWTLLLAFLLWGGPSGWAQQPPQIWSGTGTNTIGAPTIPPLPAPYVPKFRGDHSNDHDMFRRQFQSIIQAANDVSDGIQKLENLIGTTPLFPPPNTPAAQIFTVAFEIKPAVTNQNSGIVWRWIRFNKVPLNGGPPLLPGEKHPTFGPMGKSTTWWKGRANSSTPPGTLFTPSPTQIAGLPPGGGTTRPLPRPNPQSTPTQRIGVKVNSIVGINNQGNKKITVLRIITNPRKNTPIRVKRRTQNGTGATSRPSLFPKKPASFATRLKSLPSSRAQRIVLRFGRR